MRCLGFNLTELFLRVLQGLFMQLLVLIVVIYMVVVGHDDNTKPTHTLVPRVGDPLV
jgi:hypothetical protein